MFLRNKNSINKNTSFTVIKSGIWFTLCNIITKGIGFFTTPIFTRLLTKSEFGDFNNFTTWTGIILIITSLNLESSMIRARFDFKDDLDCYVASMSCLSIISTILCFILTFVFIQPFEYLLMLDKKEIFAMFLYLLFYPVIPLFQTRERFEYKYKNTVAITLLVVISTSFLSVILVLLLENKLTGRIMGSVLPIIIIGIILNALLFRKAGGICIRYWKYAIPFTIPFIPHLLSMYLLGSMDKVMIKQICGSEDLALYSLAYTIGAIISLLVNSMNSAFSPWLSEQLSTENYTNIKKNSVFYVAVFIFFSVLIILITPEVLLFMGGEGYAAAKYVMPQISAGCLMQFIYCMYVNVEQYEKKTIGMAFASVIAALFNYLTNYIFIRKLGYIAASYTTFFSYLLLMLLHLYLVKRIKSEDIFDNKKILFLSAIGSAILISSNFIFEYTVIRYFIAGILLFISIFAVYKKRTIIFKYIKNRK